VTSEVTRWSDSDRQCMQRAFELARRGLYSTDPNPRVGCVLVREGQIVAEGWHAQAGGLHAEAHALSLAGAAARGATAYVTLEPCDHHGRTPPCSQALVDAGVARVVYALEDPFPAVAGKGAARLRAHGIRVDAGLMSAESEALNPGYLKRMRTGLPHVRLKLAASLDGHTALASGESRWITSAAARDDVQRGRAQSSVILTGVGTILADDPALDVRLAHAERQPLRVVLDSQLRLPPDARVLQGAGNVLVMAAVDDADRRRTLTARGAEVVMVPSHGGRPSLAAVLRLLAARAVNEIWVEAGPVLAGAFVRERLFDELVIYLAPSLLGSGARPLLELPALASLADRSKLRFTACLPIGDDLRITAVAG
jgi:diaminohydroxyphosphoribosylaminopyrimidine deaminase / 5-amino-6-(5-phosphoribosylamino)uracil reductase